MVPLAVPCQMKNETKIEKLLIPLAIAKSEPYSNKLVSVIIKLLWLFATEIKQVQASPKQVFYLRF
jgi:hypothetical protein